MQHGEISFVKSKLSDENRKILNSPRLEAPQKKIKIKKLRGHKNQPTTLDAMLNHYKRPKFVFAGKRTNLRSLNQSSPSKKSSDSSSRVSNTSPRFNNDYTHENVENETENNAPSELIPQPKLLSSGNQDTNLSVPTSFDYESIRAKKELNPSSFGLRKKPLMSEKIDPLEKYQADLDSSLSMKEEEDYSESGIYFDESEADRFNFIKNRTGEVEKSIEEVRVDDEDLGKYISAINDNLSISKADKSANVSFRNNFVQ